jgi:predicted enzyme related to lactoylglutathione lyase
MDAAAARIIEWGGTQLSGVQELGGHTWRVMADPEGNQFCI